MNDREAMEMELTWMAMSDDAARTRRVAQRRLTPLPLAPDTRSPIAQPWHVAMRAHARR